MYKIHKTFLAALIAFTVSQPAFSDFEKMTINQNNIVADTGGVDGVSELADTLTDGVMLRVDESSAQNARICFDAFPNGVVPYVYSKSLAENSIMLCNRAYVTAVNKDTKTPVYSAEYINQSMVIGSAALKPHEPEKTNYRRDTRLPEPYQVIIDQYDSLFNPNSLYAMAELTPPNTQTTDLDRFSTYNLSNIAPINRSLYKGLLNNINNGIRKYIYEQAKEGYIVTGTHYEGSSYRIGNVNGAAVPAYIYKAFYFPTLGLASAYWIKNDEVNRFDVISIAELTKRIKVDVFPDLSPNIKNKTVYPPRPYKGNDDYLAEFKSIDNVDVDFFLNNEKEIKGSDLKSYNEEQNQQ